MRLVVFHYHDRPGGVRTAIERGLPEFVAALGGVREVVLAGGSRADADWRDNLRRAIRPVPLRTLEDPALGYLSEFDGVPDEARIAARLEEAVGSGPAVVWAHNLSVGRNVRVLRALPDVCRRAGALLCLHHHDWWIDGRWGCLADWRLAGVDDPDDAVRQTIPIGDGIRHWCLHPADRALVEAAGAGATVVGNPLTVCRTDPDEVARAADWLNRRCGGRRVVLMPSRFLRRKNPAEAVLLGRWLMPDAAVATTGGPSSPREVPAFDRLMAFAASADLPYFPALTASSDPAPGVPALIAAADALAFPSLQEGFGLAAVEAAESGRPVAIRHLAGPSAALAAAGYSFPGEYSALPVDRECHDRSAEADRIADGLARLESELSSWIGQIAPPDAGGDTVDFGSLSLTAQLETIAALPPPPPQLAPFLPAAIDPALAAARRPEALAARLVTSLRSPPLAPAAAAPPLATLVRHRVREVLRRPALWL